MSLTDPFGCKETYERLYAYLDRELSPEEIEMVEHHLAACSVCAQEYVFEAGLLKHIRDRVRAETSESSPSARFLTEMRNQVSLSLADYP